MNVAELFWMIDTGAAHGMTVTLMHLGITVCRQPVFDLGTQQKGALACIAGDSRARQLDHMRSGHNEQHRILQEGAEVGQIALV